MVANNIRYRGPMRALAMSLCSAMAIALPTITVPAAAQAAPSGWASEKVSFNIPSQDLADALQWFAQQADIQLVANSADIRGLQSRSLIGRFTRADALSRMLGSAPVSGDWSGARTLVIKRRESAGIPAAHAQFSPVSVAVKPEDGPLAEIIVTAQKRETNLQKTPISISVLGADAIENSHVASLTNLGTSVPGLTIFPFFTRTTALVATIRGVGGAVDSNQPGIDQGVGVYIDGVYLGRTQGLGSALYDIERIEVLKGPQGTLFGRNTEGGAISIVTRKPRGEFHMNTTVGLSNFNGHEAETHIDLPEFHDLSIKVDALLKKRGGTVANPREDAVDFNAYDKRGLHIAALWQPVAGFTALYSFDVAEDGSTPYYAQLVEAGSAPVAPIVNVSSGRQRRADVGVPQKLNMIKSSGHSLTLEWKLTDALRLKSISAYRRVKQDQSDIITNLSTFTPNGAFGRNSIAHLWQKQYSQELQIIGDLPEISFVGGGYYYRDHAHDDAWSPNTLRWNADGTAAFLLPEPIGRSPFPDRASSARAESVAAFAQASWTPVALDERAHLSAGIRYTHDNRKGSLELVNGAVPTVNGVTAPQRFAKNWSRVDPMINLSVDLAERTMVYGKWSTGYRAGGANSRSLTYRPFNPETVSTFELGMKAELLDRRVRANVAAYSTRYKNQQIVFIASFVNANRSTQETVNAPGVGRIKGLEADITIAPVRGLTLSGSYAYTDINLPRATNPFVAGNPVVRIFPTSTPKHSASGAVDYETPLGGVTFKAHLDANFASRQYPEAGFPDQSDRTFLVNGRLAVADISLGREGTSLELAVWSRNLLNHETIFYTLRDSALGRLGVFNEPRTFGVTAKVMM